MNVKEVKWELSKKNFQVSILDLDGVLLDSCHDIIDLNPYVGKPIFKSFDVFFGLSDAIYAMEAGSPPFLMPVINFSYNNTDHQFSFEFHRKEDHILWVIRDNSAFMPRLRAMQQERNNSVILLERIREQELQLRTINARLERANKDLDRFAYIVSHDLKSPLRAVRNLSEWIAEGLESGEMEEVPGQLKLLGERVSKMERLIHAILQYSHVGREKSPLREVNVIDVVEEVIDSLGAREKADIVLPSSIALVRTHRIWLEQVFSNLLSNALKYGKKDGCKITITCRDLDEQLEFGVEDNGLGVPEEHRERVFDIFETLNVTNGYDSTGVGLTIVRKLVREAGGIAYVEDAPSGGARFVFTWPK